MAIGYAGEFKDHIYRAELEGIYSAVKVDNIGLANSQMMIGYEKTTIQDKETYALILDHDNIQNTSVIANFYHHWKSDRFSFSPYVGAGVGVTRMKMFEQTSIKPAYQLKAGLDYRMTEDTNLHIGYRHFGAVGSEFKIPETLKWDANFDNGQNKAKGKFIKQTSNKVDTTIQNGFFGTHGVEVGLTVHFASKS